MKKVTLISLLVLATLGVQAQKTVKMVMVNHEDYMRILSVTVVNIDNYDNTIDVLWDLRKQRIIELEQTPFKQVSIGDTFMIRADINRFNTLKWNDLIEYRPKNKEKDVL